MSYSRQKVVNTVCAWEGKNEADGSYKSIIDIYNTLPSEELPRGTRMVYGWAWCACTWSAIAIYLKYREIMPIEISCSRIIEAAKRMGIWVENDAYVPKPGDAILYDWNDNGYGDNTGDPDHIGTVISVNENAGYMVVMEGNYNSAVKRRTISLNGRYIRGFICPKYDSNDVSDQTQEGGKNITAIAREVISGMWSNGNERKRALEEKGYDYNEVQKEVNRILNGSDGNPTDQKQQEVISTCYAKHKDDELAGTYITTDALYCRNDAGTNMKALCLIPEGTEVQNYGYYNVSDGIKWLYIQFKLNGVKYTGFSSKTYLRKK